MDDSSRYMYNFRLCSYDRVEEEMQSFRYPNYEGNAIQNAATTAQRLLIGELGRALPTRLSGVPFNGSNSQ